MSSSHFSPLPPGSGEPADRDLPPGAASAGVAEVPAPRPSGVDDAVVVEPSAAEREERGLNAPVRSLRQVRPVLEPAPVPVRPLSHRPVYDPFSARRRRTPEWLISHTVSRVVTDLVAAGVGVAVALLLPVGGGTPSTALIQAVVGGWVVLLALAGTYAERRLGSGPDEYRRVTVAGLVAVVVLAFVLLLAEPVGVRPLVLVGAPLATLATLAGRVLQRRRLHTARRRGLMTKTAIVVGRDVAVADLVRRLRRDTTAGLTVVGACVPRPGESAVVTDEDVPVLGTLEEAVRVIDEARVDAVVIASASETAGRYLRDLAWRLEGTNVDVLVGPGLIEVSSDRLQVRPTTSMPLIQVREPEFRGSRRLVKSLMDRAVAALLLLLSAPLMIGVVLAVRLTSPGPAFYRHRRIGKRGREFDLLKFRSMVTDADSRIDALMALNEGNEVQFKMRRDPRVTRVGQVLRKYSIDELPQLVNVLKGDMSLVGPRPHVTREVEQYGPEMHRRLLVKPGITGLWQVSGRSDLTWDESVELDVRYVENWSIGLDLTIMWRTARAVLASAGAY